MENFIIGNPLKQTLQSGAFKHKLWMGACLIGFGAINQCDTFKLVFNGIIIISIARKHQRAKLISRLSGISKY